MSLSCTPHMVGLISETTLDLLFVMLYQAEGLGAGHDPLEAVPHACFMLYRTSSRFSLIEDLFSPCRLLFLHPLLVGYHGLRNGLPCSMKAFLLLLLIWTSHSTAQIDGIFYNPFPPGTTSDFTQNPTYQVGSTVQLRWSVTWDRISLCLTQNGNPEYEFLLRKKASLALRRLCI